MSSVQELTTENAERAEFYRYCSAYSAVFAVKTTFLLSPLRCAFARLWYNVNNKRADNFWLIRQQKPPCGPSGSEVKAKTEGAPWQSDFTPEPADRQGKSRWRACLFPPLYRRCLAEYFLTPASSAPGIPDPVGIPLLPSPDSPVRKKKTSIDCGFILSLDQRLRPRRFPFFSHYQPEKRSTYN